MYDEIEYVLTSIKNIRNTYSNDATIVVVQSEYNEKDNSEIVELSDIFFELPNLGETYNRFELPSQAITRNISKGMSLLYGTEIHFDIIVIFTGDTLITDATNIERRYVDIRRNKWVAMVSQALGQNFHSANSDPPNNNSGGRVQKEDTTDFACCYFLLDGEFAQKEKSFSDIKLTNKWTSEQCLGDELISHIGTENFKKMVGILNNDNRHIPYSYSDGIIYHAKNNGIPSR